MASNIFHNQIFFRGVWLNYGDSSVQWDQMARLFIQYFFHWKQLLCAICIIFILEYDQNFAKW